MSSLYPGSLALCQRVSRRFNGVSASVMDSANMKSNDDKRVYGVEKLYDLYHELGRVRIS